MTSALGLPPANLSFHLKAMTQSGLLTVQQEGRFQRYRADVALMTSLVDYLTEESRDLVGKAELSAFHDDVDDLRDRAERLAARYARLAPERGA